MPDVVAPITHAAPEWHETWPLPLYWQPAQDEVAFVAPSATAIYISPSVLLPGIPFAEIEQPNIMVDEQIATSSMFSQTIVIGL